MDARNWRAGDPALDARIKEVHVGLHRARVAFGTGRLSADQYADEAAKLGAELAKLERARFEALLKPSAPKPAKNAGGIKRRDA